MGNRNESAKVLQTKHLLASQLMELLKNRSLKKISVNDICQGALISRSTFYLHFEDKYRLLQYCFEKEIGRWETSTRGKTAQETILYILDAILEKKDSTITPLWTNRCRNRLKSCTRYLPAFLWISCARKKRRDTSFPGRLLLSALFMQAA